MISTMSMTDTPGLNVTIAGLKTGHYRGKDFGKLSGSRL
jgi:hypothetical protein